MMSNLEEAMIEVFGGKIFDPEDPIPFRCTDIQAERLRLTIDDPDESVVIGIIIQLLRVNALWETVLKIADITSRDHPYYGTCNLREKELLDQWHTENEVVVGKISEECRSKDYSIIDCNCRKRGVIRSGTIIYVGQWVKEVYSHPLCLDVLKKCLVCQSPSVVQYRIEETIKEWAPKINYNA